MSLKALAISTGSVPPSQELPVSMFTPRDFGLPRQSITSRRPWMESVTGPWGSSSTFTPKSSAIRQGTASFSAMVKMRS